MDQPKHILFTDARYYWRKLQNIKNGQCTGDANIIRAAWCAVYTIIEQSRLVAEFTEWEALENEKEGIYDS